MILDTLSHHLDAYKNTGGCPAEITYHGLFKSDKSGNLEEQVTLIKRFRVGNLGKRDRMSTPESRLK